MNDLQLVDLTQVNLIMDEYETALDTVLNPLHFNFHTHIHIPHFFDVVNAYPSNTPAEDIINDICRISNQYKIIFRYTNEEYTFMPLKEVW